MNSAGIATLPARRTGAETRRPKDVCCWTFDTWC